MLNLALVGLLAGSLASATSDGDRDKNKDKNVQASPAAEAAPAPEPEDPRSIIQDTYAFGMASDAAPIKLWVHYAYGEAERLYGLDGQGRPEISIAGTDFDLVSQRIGVGAQINLLNFPSFKLGVGGQLNIAQDKLQAGGGGTLGDLESDFGLQGVKAYGLLKGRVVGIHGGYIFDLGSEGEFDASGLPTALPTSDERDAFFFGADFDYPSEVFRLFGGVDYYSLEARLDNAGASAPFPDGADDGDNILFFTTGLGVRLSVFEIGAALHIRTQLKSSRLSNPDGSPLDVGSHVGSIAPYLRISPPSLPASIFVKGSVLEEYTDYGYSMGGAGDFVTRLGVTAGITVGFE